MLVNRFCKSFEQDSWAPLGLGGNPPEARGGFYWGYVDLLDVNGSGVVVIWGHGMPFSPGILSAERAGRPVVARDAPSLCIAVYDRGRQVFYLLRDLSADASIPDVLPMREAQSPSFGGLTLAREPSALTLTFDVAIPGGAPLQGTVRVEGTALDLPAAGPAVHRWAPQLVGSATADLAAGSWRFTMSGRGYHDGNSSSLGLSELGIQRWIWGRTPHPDGEIVHYLLEPVTPGTPEQNHVLEIDWSGAVEHRFVEVERERNVRGKWGLRAPRSLRAGDLTIRHVSAFEDSPYYQRWLTSVTGPDGVEHAGVGEVVVIDRIDRGAYMPLVRMALDGPSPSMWVPLFCGPQHNRFQRLVRYWLGRSE